MHTSLWQPEGLLDGAERLFYGGEPPPELPPPELPRHDDAPDAPVPSPEPLPPDRVREPDEGREPPVREPRPGQSWSEAASAAMNA